MHSNHQPGFWSLSATITCCRQLQESRPWVGMAVVSAPVTFIFVRCVPVLLTAWFGGWSAPAESHSGCDWQAFRLLPSLACSACHWKFNNTALYVIEKGHWKDPCPFCRHAMLCCWALTDRHYMEGMIKHTCDLCDRHKLFVCTSLKMKETDPIVYNPPSIPDCCKAEPDIYHNFNQQLTQPGFLCMPFGVCISCEPQVPGLQKAQVFKALSATAL